MQGFNMGRYVPPEHEGVTSANKLAGKNALGSRARNVNSSGALTVRFEMPFPVWCSTCKPPASSRTADADNDPEHVIIGQGVRFNAEKKRVGNYYSTPIWSFRMKHSVCGGWIEIRTDPQNAEYVVVEGGKRRAISKDDDEREGLWIEEPGAALDITVRNKEGGGDEDPFSKLESKTRDEKGFMTARTRMEELRKRQGRDWEDPYEKSKKLRRAFRAERKNREAAQDKADALKDKMSLGLELAEEKEADQVRAEMVEFGSGAGTATTGIMRKRGLFDLPSTSGRTHSKNATKSKPGNEKGRRKKKSTVDTSSERKSMLQQELSGNTRAAVDPFLSNEKVWQPTPSVKRKAETTKSESVLTGPSNGNGQGGEDKTVGDVSNKINGSSRAETSTNLVHYGSDSD